MNRMFSYVDLA